MCGKIIKFYECAGFKSIVKLLYCLVPSSNGNIQFIATEYCRSDGGTGSLTESSLKRILNTGLSEGERMFGVKHNTQDTYLTFDFGKTVYKQLNKDTHAEDRMLSDQRSKELIYENGIWLNNSPCPRCAKTIMRAYSDSEQKPTIYVQSVYIQQGLDSTLDSLMCLGRMLKEGFNIVPWDWRKFKNNLGVNPSSSCVQYIDEAVNNQGFKSKRRVVQKALRYLEAIKGCVKEEWCQDSQDE